MNSTVTLLRKSSKELGMSAPAIIHAAGYSKNNWYQWKSGKNNPSAEAAQKILSTIEKERAAKGLAVTSTESAPVSRMKKESINAELVVRRDELAKAQSIVNALELLLTVA